MSDICVNKHGHNPQSEAANARIDPYKRTMKDRIYEFICDQDRGATAEDVVSGLGFKLQSVSARCAEMKAENRIMEDGVRNGYAILRPAGQKRLFQ